MTTLTGLERLKKNKESIPGKSRVGILCHAPSIDNNYTHIKELLGSMGDITLAALFGPQHGIFGETQDNMIEWQSRKEKNSQIPIYSLYGEERKPTPSMLEDIDLFIVDLQDVGARLYTYIWTVKLCMEACAEMSIPVLILDRPNPIAAVRADGPLLQKDYYTFVGGAEIPLCHRMTLAEMALWINSYEATGCNLAILEMEQWNRSMMFNQTGLPWVLPSPNMPALSTAIVYPGTVLFEATNVSEGRGTTIPFELFGAPFINSRKLLKYLESKNIAGCRFREHDFIPTFHKFTDEYCHGIQIHVTDNESFRPVRTMFEILRGIIETSPPDSLQFLQPPYEYEYELLPFDILSGDDSMRRALESGTEASVEFERWDNDFELFLKKFERIKLYSDK